MNRSVCLGIDEVGRGCVAGPVYVGFCVLKKGIPKNALDGIKDSKKLSEKKRNEWFSILRDLEDLGYMSLHVEQKSSSYIDTYGIQNAIHSAIAEGLLFLAVDTHLDIFLDGGLSVPKMYFSAETIIKGDEKVPVISCASIYAKVMRDTLMSSLEKEDVYFFSKHKGYGTEKHMEIIQTHGFSKEHRKSFLKKFL